MTKTKWPTFAEVRAQRAKLNRDAEEAAWLLRTEVRGLDASDQDRIKPRSLASILKLADAVVCDHR